MATKYSAFVFPQVKTRGGSVISPQYPETFGQMVGASLNWDLYSSNPKDRTQYWEDTNGTLSYNDVLISIYGMDGLKQNKIAEINYEVNQTITGGFSYTINGSQYTITLTQTDQTNLLSNSISTSKIISNAQSWKASTTFPPDSSIYENGHYYITFNGGTTGSTKPTFPSKFNTPVSDNNIKWYLYGVYVGTDKGNIRVTAQNMENIYTIGTRWIDACRSKYDDIKAQIHAATTVDAINSFTWVAPPVS